MDVWAVEIKFPTQDSLDSFSNHPNRITITKKKKIKVNGPFPQTVKFSLGGRAALTTIQKILKDMGITEFHFPNPKSKISTASSDTNKKEKKDVHLNQRAFSLAKNMNSHINSPLQSPFSQKSNDNYDRFSAIPSPLTLFSNVSQDIERSHNPNLSFADFQKPNPRKGCSREIMLICMKFLFIHYKQLEEYFGRSSDFHSLKNLLEWSDTLESEAAKMENAKPKCFDHQIEDGDIALILRSLGYCALPDPDFEKLKLMFVPKYSSPESVLEPNVPSPEKKEQEFNEENEIINPSDMKIDSPSTNQSKGEIPDLSEEMKEIQLKKFVKISKDHGIVLHNKESKSPERKILERINDELEHFEREIPKIFPQVNGNDMIPEDIKVIPEPDNRVLKEISQNNKRELSEISKENNENISEQLVKGKSIFQDRKESLEREMPGLIGGPLGKRTKRGWNELQWACNNWVNIVPPNSIESPPPRQTRSIKQSEKRNKHYFDQLKKLMKKTEKLSYVCKLNERHITVYFDFVGSFNQSKDYYEEFTLVKVALGYK